MTINPHHLDLSGTNLILESLLHQGTASTVYKCTSYMINFLLKQLGVTNESKKTRVCVKRVKPISILPILTLLKKDIAQVEKVLGKEVKLVQALKGIIPAYISSFKNKDSVLLVTELAGPSVYEQFLAMKKKFSIQTIVMIGLNILGLLEQIHARGLIHGNVEPKKILTDRNANNSNLYLVGLSSMKKFKNERGEHIRYRERSQGEQFILNNFSSGNKHIGRISRRDDIESLAYVLLYFDTQGEIFDLFKGKDIQAWKAFTPADQMHPTAASGLVKLLNYAKNLGFEERPDYEIIRAILESMLPRSGSAKYSYDWNPNITIQSPSNMKVSQKRKALCGLLTFEKKQFSIILEEQFEEGDSCIPSPQKYLTGDTKVDLSPQMNKTCGQLQLPTFKTQFFREAISDEKTSKADDIAVNRSPWNCSDIPDDMQPIFQKVQSLQTKTSLAIICGFDEKDF